MIAKLLMISLLAMIVVVSGCVQEAAPQDTAENTTQDTVANITPADTSSETTNDTNGYEDVGYW